MNMLSVGDPIMKPIRCSGQDGKCFGKLWKLPATQLDGIDLALERVFIYIHLYSVPYLEI